MKKKRMKIAHVTEGDIERVRKARRLVYDAIGELCQSRMAIHLSRQINELNIIEDVLWQFTTPMKGERSDGSHAAEH